MCAKQVKGKALRVEDLDVLFASTATVDRLDKPKGGEIVVFYDEHAASAENWRADGYRLVNDVTLSFL